MRRVIEFTCFYSFFYPRYLQKRLFSHIQRMGAVNALMLSKDQTHVVSVGQEKRMTYWDINAANPVHAISLDGENDEGKCIAR